MKKWTILLAAMLLLNGCGRAEPASTSAPEEETTEMTTEVTETTTSVTTTTQTTSTSTSMASETDATSEAAQTTSAATTTTAAPATTTTAEPEAYSNVDVYRDILDTLWNEGKFPDGDTADTQGDLTENQFAVYDIDGDGREELLLDYESASMAGMRFLIWDADENGNVYEEMGVFPAVTFYNNGSVTVGVSHNQGYAGDFWPYSLLQYDAATDGYRNVTFVDAMDRNNMEMRGVLDEYPEDADTSGSGFVYFIGDDNPVDQKEYDAWYTSVLGGATEISIPWQMFSPENFVSLR